MEKNKSKALESALFHLTRTQKFYGSLLQEINMSYSSILPTAAFQYDSKRDQFKILINPDFFMSLSLGQRAAVLHHEILHFTNKHMFRVPFIAANDEERKLYNIAGDMAINQYITDLPDGCINVDDWVYDDNGIIKPFPKYQSMEIYYDLIKNNQQQNQELLDKYKAFDEHDWEALDEETKQKMLEEAKKVLKRTVEKTQFGHSNVPDSVKDLIEELETMSAAINYRQILKQAIKKTVSCADRATTWKKPNKRYGLAAPGTKMGELPHLSIYGDTSGSISITEFNQFLDIISNFLKTGSRKCTLGLWHTDLYYKKPYKLNQKLPEDAIESGGTAIECVLTDIKNHNPDLAIILTDGHYEESTVKPTSEVIWIISKGGNQDHPLKNLGKTILLDKLGG